MVNVYIKEKGNEKNVEKEQEEEKEKEEVCISESV